MSTLLERVAEQAGVEPAVALRVWQAITAVTNEPDDYRRVAVGFVDLQGFTEMSRRLGERELAELVARFESTSYHVVVEGGGRVVKMIGDEVMFVADDPATAVRIATRLVDEAAADPLLPEARAGLSCGPVLLRLGDCHGPAVNLASRLAKAAPEGAVVACDDVRRAVGDDDGTTWLTLGERDLKGFGQVAVWLASKEMAAATPKWSEG